MSQHKVLLSSRRPCKFQLSFHYLFDCNLFSIVSLCFFKAPLQLLISVLYLNSSVLLLMSDYITSIGQITLSQLFATVFRKIFYGSMLFFFTNSRCGDFSNVTSERIQAELSWNLVFFCDCFLKGQPIARSDYFPLPKKEAAKPMFACCFPLNFTAAWLFYFRIVPKGN